MARRGRGAAAVRGRVGLRGRGRRLGRGRAWGRRGLLLQRTQRAQRLVGPHPPGSVGAGRVEVRGVLLDRRARVAELLVAARDVEQQIRVVIDRVRLDELLDRAVVVLLAVEPGARLVQLGDAGGLGGLLRGGGRRAKRRRGEQQDGEHSVRATGSWASSGSFDEPGAGGRVEQARALRRDQRGLGRRFQRGRLRRGRRRAIDPVSRVSRVCARARAASRPARSPAWPSDAAAQLRRRPARRARVRRDDAVARVRFDGGRTRGVHRRRGPRQRRRPGPRRRHPRRQWRHAHRAARSWARAARTRARESS